MRAEREGRGFEPVAAPARAGPLRARDQAGRTPDARDAGREVPHGARGRRVRRHLPASSPWRTASRSWSARSSTSTTKRTDDVERLPTGELHRRRRLCHRRAQRAARDRPCPTRTGTPSAASSSATLGHVPAEGESRRVRTGTGFIAEQGRRPPHRQRAWSRRWSDVGPTATASVDGHRAVETRDGELPLRLRVARRAAERRQVDPAERHPRAEGEHRLRQAADHSHPGPRRARTAPTPSSCSWTRPGLHKPVTRARGSG